MRAYQCDDRQEILSQLRKQVRQKDLTPLSTEFPPVSTGGEALDQLFPQRGIARGSLIEWLGGIGGGAGVLSLIAARHLSAQGGYLVVIDRQRSFYPVCAATWGIDLKRVIVVRPKTVREELWAYDQCLRCEAVAVVWGYLDHLDSRDFRRLQLSAEAGRGIGLLLRPSQAAKEPTWADVRLQVEPYPSVSLSPRYRVRVLHCRGTQAGGEKILTIDETTGLVQEASAYETHHVHLVSPLVDSASHLGQTGT